MEFSLRKKFLLKLPLTHLMERNPVEKILDNILGATTFEESSTATLPKVNIVENMRSGSTHNKNLLVKFAKGVLSRFIFKFVPHSSWLAWQLAAVEKARPICQT